MTSDELFNSPTLVPSSLEWWFQWYHFTTRIQGEYARQASASDGCSCGLLSHTGHISPKSISVVLSKTKAEMICVPQQDVLHGLCSCSFSYSFVL
jgi:hypothetical protein